MARIVFYDATELDRQQLDLGLRGTDHDWYFIDEKISSQNIDPEAEVISVFVTSSVTAEMIQAMPKLRLIACRSTGFNNIDFASAESQGVTVVNVPTYGESTVAEYAFTLLLSFMRNTPKVFLAENERINQTELLGNDLNGKTIGVVGTGHIGQHTIKIALGFGMKVLAYDPFPNYQLTEDLAFEYVSFEDLLHRADIISLHAPYLKSTHHMIDESALKQMKQGAVLVNTARGELIDTKALVNALNEGHLGGAALDVVEGEALLNHHEEVALLRSESISEETLRHSVEISSLKKMPNVIISPHNAFNTIEAIGRINQTTSENIIDYWYDKIPNKVSPPSQQYGKFIVVRHTESEWNATGKWTGITDVHLSELGFRQAAQLGRLLKTQNIKIDIAYCSQQIRARETLEGILDAAQQFEVDILRDKAINERDYGDLTGKQKWEIKDQIGEEQFNAIRRGWDVPIPNGETLKMVYERVVPFYQQTLLPKVKSGQNVLVVAHGNSIRALMKYIESIPDDEVKNLEMIFGEFLFYDVDENGKMLQKEVASIGAQPKR